MSQEEEIYQEHVLDHYDDPYHRGRCPRPTHTHEDDNPLCGDVVKVELRIEDDHVREAWIKDFGAEEMLNLFRARLTPNRQKCCLLSWRVVQSALYSPIDGHGRGIDE